MLLVTGRLNRVITLDSNEYTVAFTDQILRNYLKQNTRSNSSNSSPLRKNQKLGQVFKKLDDIFLF